MTTLLFRDDAYLAAADATVTAVHPSGALVLDRTIFYPAAGGQPGDGGTLRFGATDLRITNTQYAEDRTTVLHAIEGPLPETLAPGAQVAVALDWSVRHRHMRMHTALHLLCSLVPHPVTGGQIGAAEGRLDFDIPDADAVDKDRLTAGLLALIAADHPVAMRWITDDELAANPQLVRTMAVKPPMGTGRVRLVEIGMGGAVDCQPCGGTHVGRTGEIGAVAVTKIEKKGKQNRRIRVAFAN
jgi:misacylated tRNA(Ala) deacylase